MVMGFVMNKKRREWPNSASAPDGDAIAERAGVWDRITARWRSRRLDFALAAGAPPESTPAFALRARRLVDLSHRRSMADALRRIVREAHEGVHPSFVRIVPRRSRVAAASGELGMLADALAEPGPVQAQGVAVAWILLTDGTGPLYDASSTASLRATAISAAEGLRLWGA
jgi:hypothetical protein